MHARKASLVAERDAFMALQAEATRVNRCLAEADFWIKAMKVDPV
jgi:hypothetical protein